jgi:hypothetical protein
MEPADAALAHQPPGIRKSFATKRHSDEFVPQPSLSKRIWENRSIMASENINGCFWIVDENLCKKIPLWRRLSANGHSTYWKELCKISYGLSR